MAERIEKRMALLGLGSDGSKIQKAMQNRVKRDYSRSITSPETTQSTSGAVNEEATVPPSTKPTQSVKFVDRIHTLFPNEDISEPVVQPKANTSNSVVTTAQGTVTPAVPANDMFGSSRPQQSLHGRPVVGMPAQPNETFCAFLAMSKLPYKFIFDKNLGQKISVDCFADGRFYRQGWTIYYIWPISNAAKPLLLVPQSEVHTFVQTINRQFPQAGLSMGRLSSRFPGLTIQFRSKHTQLRPRFLGVIRDQEQYQRLQINIPSSTFQLPGEDFQPELDEELPEVKQYDLQLFQALDLGGNKKKGSSKHATPQAREEYQTNMQLDFKDNLEMVEQFLGLRAPKPKRVSLPSDWTAAMEERSWEEELAGMKTKAAAKEPPPAVDPSKPAPFGFCSNVIFVCVDVEAYEKDSSKITEIGISTLDTNDLAGAAPGELGSQWRSKIRVRHFRIQEHAHLRNGTFVHDNAGNFKFGSSEFITLNEAPKTIAACFRGYDPAITTAQEEKRTIVLVGHDVAADVRFLLRMGYDVSNLSTLHKSNPVIDTQKLFRAYHKIKKPSLVTAGQQPISLAVVMEELDIAPFGLHNAGNDAAYTMQVMIGMAVDAAQFARAAGVDGQVAWNGDLNAFKKPAKPEDDAPTWEKLDEADW